MDLEPLTSFQTPPRKVRKTAATQSSPTRLSDLMAAFGARKLPMSPARMGVQSDRQRLRQLKQPPLSYAESESDVTPQTSPGSSFEGSLGSSKAPIELSDDGEDHDDQESENEQQPDQHHDEIQSDDDVIVVATRSSRTRELPNRSTRSNVNYATPKKSKQQQQKKKIPKRRNPKPFKFTSDLLSAQGSEHVETERTRIHDDIAETTEPKRNAFILAHKEHFLPLLPEKNYLNKLQRLNNDFTPSFVPYKALSSQPKGVVATMKPYQLEGLSFLAYMQENGMSAILGDEMGLGKTLQTLSLFQYMKNKDLTKNRPFLVVCPLSVLTSWMNEAKKWVPELNVVRFHGPKTERDKLKQDCRTAKASTIDGIVTTYESFVAEQGWFKRAFVYCYCVLDEGHKIKNSKSNVAHALQSLNAEFRLLLSGTPLQNNLSEMWSLLHWLYPEVFDERTADNFKRAFDLTKGNVSTAFMDNARRLLELVMLRRMKTSPGVDLGLPPKEEILLYVPLTPMQRFWYNRLLTKADDSILDELFKGAKAKEVKALQVDAEEDVWAESRDIVEKAIQNEQLGNQSEWRRLMNLILQLRKVSCHPYILRGAAPDPYYLGDHVKTASGKFVVLDKLLDELVIRQGRKILIFAGLTCTLDLCEDLLYLKGFNAVEDATAFRYLRLDGSTSRARRNLGIRMFNDVESAFKIMLISTRAGGLGINLASASDVVFLDEDWNPQVTLQAEARAHRIGQTQPVTVYKLLSSGTVEEQMMGRIRKKLYLSAKITESMRNIHNSPKSRKRKRGCNEPASDAQEDSDAPQLDTSSLKSLIRRGAQTLARPAIDVTEILGWDWQTALEKCKDQAVDPSNTTDVNGKEEEDWLNSMEKVECAIFEGKKHQKQVEQSTKQTSEFKRADRRAGKNTTVIVDGFAISKESLNCGEWEAVPTMAGKDPRLSEPVKIKKAVINNQDFCQHCWDGGSLVICSGCPRAFHRQCLDKSFQQKAKGMVFYCPQHECVDCQAKTSDAGGLIYRCRWCESGFCEDCLDFETVRLVGETLPEYQMLGFGAMENAWYIECPSCVKHWSNDKEERARIYKERERIGQEYEAFVAAKSDGVETPGAAQTPVTVSEVGTPRDVEIEMTSKILKMP